MQTLTIDKTQFFAGERSEDFVDDGGYGQNSSGINPIYKRGMIYGQESAPTQLSADLGADIIASCVDEDLLGNDRVLVDDDGQLYTVKGTTLTARANGGTASGNWNDGTTDLIYFRGRIYGTTTTEIVRFTGSDYTSVDDDWWTVTEGRGGLQSSYRHPMEVVEGILYIADKDDIHLFDGSNSQEDAMTLPGECNITAMVKHPNGRNMIAFTSGTANASGTLNSKIHAYVIDTVSLEFISEIELEEQIFSAHVHKGVVYVRYGEGGHKFGYFDGSAIQPIRIIGEPGDSLDGYKHTMKTWGDFLIITTDDKVFAYGQIFPGTNAFWTIDDKADDFIFADLTKDNRILVQYEDGSSEKVILRDFEEIGIELNFETGQISLPVEGAIRKITFEHSEIPATGTWGFDVFYEDTDSDAVQIGNVEYDDHGETIRKSTIYCNVFCDTYFNIRLSNDNGAIGFSKMIIYYEGNE